MAMRIDRADDGYAHNPNQSYPNRQEKAAMRGDGGGGKAQK